MAQSKRDIAIMLMRKQRFDEALDLFKELLSIDSKDDSLFYMAGQCCRFLGDLKSAITYLENAVYINSREPAYFLALGIAYQLNKHFDNAINTLVKAIEIDNDCALLSGTLIE